MPKRQKINISTNLDKEKIIEVKENSKTQTSQISKFELLIIFILVSITAIFFLHRRVSDLSIYIPVSDEVDIINGVTKGIPEIGIFATLFTKKQTEHNFFDNKAMRPYKLECEIRYPFYMMLKNSSLNWISFSNLFLFYALTAFSLIFLIFKKKDKAWFISVSFFIILMAVSTWTASSFHYARYFSFLILSSAFVMFFNTYIYLSSTCGKLKKALIIIISSAIPALFHYQGAFMLMFWLPVAYFLLLGAIKSAENIYSKILAITLPVIIALFAVFFGSKFVITALGLINIEGFVPILLKFIKLSLPHSAAGLIAVFLFAASSVFTYKYLSKHEKTLFIFTGILFVVSTLLSALIMGNKYSDYNGANRYFTFSYAIMLIFSAVILSGIFKLVAQKNSFKFKHIAMFLVLILPFLVFENMLTPVSAKKYSFSILPRVSYTEISKIKNELKDVDYVVISSKVDIATSAFPTRKVFSIKSLENSDEFFKNAEHEYILFFRVNLRELKPEILNEIYNSDVFITDNMLLETKKLEKILK